MHKYNGRCSNLLLHSKWIGCRVRALHKNNIFLQNHNKELLLVIYIWFYRAIIAVEWCKQYYAFIIHISSDSVLTREWVCCRQQMPVSQCTDSTIRAEEKKIRDQFLFLLERAHWDVWWFSTAPFSIETFKLYGDVAAGNAGIFSFLVYCISLAIEV